MSIVQTSLTVLGTAAPWKFGGSAAAGATNAMTAWGSGYNDGSNAAGGTAGQNSAYRYGQQHVSPAGETAPTTLAVTAGQPIILRYDSGTVATQGAGAGNSTPIGSPTTGLTPVNVGESDNAGYTLPTNVIPGFRNLNLNCVVSTNGTAVTWVSGTVFDSGMQGSTVWINNVQYTVSSVTNSATLTLSGTAGVQTNIALFFYSAKTNLGGLVGAFTNSSGIIVSVFDWAGYGGTSSAASAITLEVPVGATFLSLGINDTILRDNTGSFSMTAFQFDTNGFAGDSTAPTRYPVGMSVSFLGDLIKTTVFLQSWFTPLTDFSTYGLLAGYTGQLFAHGAQNSGGAPAGTAGQNFPY